MAAATMLAPSASARAAVQASVALDELIGFSDPGMCYPSPETLALIGGFYTTDEAFLHEDGYFRVGSVPDGLRDRLGPITLMTREGWWVIRAEARGTLWGLPLSAVEQDFPVGGDPGGFTLVFKAPVADVERAARARGLPARAGQAVPLGEPDGYAYDMVLEASPDDPRLSRLSCGYS